MPTLRSVSCTALLFALPACYSYVPVELDALNPGAELRARLSAVEAERLSEMLPVVDRVLEGRVLEGDGEAVLLLVPVATRQTGGGLQTLNQRLRLGRDQVVEVELKRLDRWRTGLLVTTGAVVVGVLAARILEGGRSGTRDPGTGDPPESVVPAFTVRDVVLARQQHHAPRRR